MTIAIIKQDVDSISTGLSFQYSLSDLKVPGDVAPFKECYITVGMDGKWYLIFGAAEGSEIFTREYLDLLQELYGPNL